MVWPSIKSIIIRRIIFFLYVKKFIILKNEIQNVAECATKK